MKGRTGKQIRERFINKLDPNISTLPFDKKEDKQII
jgi:myb proto-oncogene protein